MATQDLPLTLTKATRREDALVRRALFITAALRVTRPADATDATRDSYGWTYKALLQRQVCFTSMTGLFSCTTPELEPLPDAETGDAPVETPDSFPLADAAKRRIAETLKARSAAIFAADQSSHTAPLLKASGVVAARAAPPR